jgi:hypothetical protein
VAVVPSKWPLPRPPLELTEEVVTESGILPLDAHRRHRPAGIRSRVEGDKRAKTDRVPNNGRGLGLVVE